MFWKKRPYRHPTLGEFTYVNGVWCGLADVPGSEVFVIRVDGDRNQPNQQHLDAAGKLLDAITELAQQALAYLQNRDEVREFAEGYGDFTLAGIDVGDDCFDLSFGFTEWPDGYVNVRFTGGKPTDVIMGD
jgi:hypothetical protein